MSNKTNRMIYILLGTVLLGVIVTAAVLIGSGNREAAGLSDQLDEQNQLISRLEGDEASQRKLIGELEAAKFSLEGQLASLKAELERLKSDAASNETLSSDTISYLNRQLAEKGEELSALMARIDSFEGAFGIDVLEQLDQLDEITAYIETEAPFVKTPKLDPATGEPVLKNKEPVYEWTAVADLIEAERQKAIEAGEERFLPAAKEAARAAYEEAGNSFDETAYDEALTKELRARVLAREDIVYPSVSLYYEDIGTGNRIEYRADVVYDPASVVKAPYILSILQAVSSAEKKYLDNIEKTGGEPERYDTNGDGVPDRYKAVFSDPKLDLSETVIWNKETMMKDGSGKIQSMPDGTELSYLDFVNYALRYSDNVAYQQLKDRFGYSRYYSLAAKVKATTAAKNANQMTARDAGLLFKAIYDFIDTDTRYGPIMSEAMRVANHTVIVPYAVSPLRTYHKYGWDDKAYHDAAIVMYSSKPYVIAVFTDMDNGGDAVNAYLQGLVKMVHQFHKGFHEE